MGVPRSVRRHSDPHRVHDVRKDSRIRRVQEISACFPRRCLLLCLGPLKIPQSLRLTIVGLMMLTLATCLQCFLGALFLEILKMTARRISDLRLTGGYAWHVN